jgi:hypothetical protein
MYFVRVLVFLPILFVIYKKYLPAFDYSHQKLYIQCMLIVMVRQSKLVEVVKAPTPIANKSPVVIAILMMPITGNLAGKDVSLR